MAIIKIRDNANNRMLWINTDFINSIEQYDDKTLTIFTNKYMQSLDAKDSKTFLTYYESFLSQGENEFIVTRQTEEKEND
jgi:hypothetical protein